MKPHVSTFESKNLLPLLCPTNVIRRERRAKGGNKMARRNYKSVKGYPGIYSYENREGRMYEAKYREPDSLTGKRKQVSKSFPTLNEAASYRASQIHEVRNNRRKLLQKVTLKQFYREHYEENYQNDKLEELTTRKCTKSRIQNYILPRLGSCLLEDITPARVSTFLQGLKLLKGDTPVSPKYKLNIYTDLQSMLSYAVELEFLRSNPCTKKLRPKVTRQEKPYLTNEQTQSLLCALAPKELDNRDYRPLFTCFALTGLRQSEVFGLKWGDYKPEESELQVQRAVVGTKEKGTKTSATRRSVTVPRHLALALEVEKDQAPPKYTHDHNYIFCNWNSGKPLPGDDVRKRILYPAMVEAGIAKRDKSGKIIVPQPRAYGFHILRHTVGTKIAERGGLKAAQAQLGHSNINTTGNIYAHSEKSQNQAIVNEYANEVFDSIDLLFDNKATSVRSE